MPPSRTSRSGPGHFLRAITGDCVSLALIIPLLAVVLAPGWFVGHDDLHAVRLFEHDLVLRAGQLPVRWFPDVAGGYGSPHPVFYAPLFYLLSQVFLLAGFTLTASIKAALATVLAATALSMYRFCRSFLGEGGAIVASAAYSYAPYHLLDLYVRTAFSELLVFMFLPLVLLSFHRLALGYTPWRLAGAAAALGGLFLSHTITAMLVPALILIYVSFLLWHLGFRSDLLARLAAAALLGLGLAGFFMIPLVAERNEIDISVFDTEYFNYWYHFVAPSQLLYSPWGFGLSVEGPEDGLSFRLGLLHLAGCALTLLAGSRLRRLSPPAGAFLLLAAGLGVFGILMSSEASRPIWAALPPLRYVQFPWRFLILPAFGMSIVCGAGATLMRRWRRPYPWLIAAACGLFVVCSTGMIGFEERVDLEKIRFRRQAGREPARHRTTTQENPWRMTREFVRDQLLNWNDHLPHGAYPYPPESDLERPRAEISRGRATAEVLDEDPVHYRIRVEAVEPSVLRLNVYRFPGWIWRVDGERAPPGPEPSDRTALTVVVPEGEHLAEASMVRTADRWAGEIVSLAALITIAGLLVGGTGIRSRARRSLRATAGGRDPRSLDRSDRIDTPTAGSAR